MHNPFRSESDVFRGVVLVVAGAAVATAIGAITDAAVGGIVAAALVGLAVGLVLRAGRGSMPDQIEAADRDDGIHRILVVANQTVGGRELLDEIKSRAAGRAAVETLVVCPALPHSRVELITSDTDEARREAEQRLGRSLEALRGEGLTAKGMTGDEDPVVAAGDALREFGADEVVVSTHPPAKSRWLERGVVEEIRRQTELPVAHVVVEGAAVESP